MAKWQPVLANPKTTKAKRKQIVVAMGRQFRGYWWRVRTGRCSAPQLGLRLKPVTGAVAETVARPTPTSLAHAASRVSPGG